MKVSAPMRLPQILALAIACSASLASCDRDRHSERPPDDSGSARDTGSSCDSGLLDDEGECVPAACGSGTWGDLETDGSTFFVEQAAAEGGDGSQAAPFASIQAGLDAAGDAGGGMVAVAAGTYPEPLELGPAHDGVRLAGRCSELVVIDASAGGKQTPGIHVEAMSSEVLVSGVTVSGSRYPGVLVGSGSMTIRESKLVGSEYYGIAAYTADSYETTLAVESCEVEGNAGVGVAAYDASTAVSLQETTIKDTRPDEKGQGGYGIAVHGGATLSAEACVVAGSTAISIVVGDAGTAAKLDETTIQDTQPDERGQGGYGILVLDGADLSAEACQIRDSRAAGLVASGAGTAVTLRETTIQDTRPDKNTGAGYGIDVYAGASLEAEACELSGNIGVGVGASDTGTAVTLRETTIRDSQPAEGGAFGYGIDVYGGAKLCMESCQVSDNAGIGVLAGESGTRVSLRDTTVQDTRPNGSGVGGWGVQVSNGALLEAESCLVSGNTELGVVALLSGSITLRRTCIQDTQPDEDGLFGYGIEASSGASLAVEDCEVLGNATAGIVVGDAGTVATLRETSIQDTQPGEAGAYGYGVGVVDGASLEAESCAVLGNASAGVVAAGLGTSLILLDTTISATKNGEFYTAASGIDVYDGASVQGTGVEVSSNEGPGFYLTSGDSQLSCVECVLRDNLFAGAVVVEDASLELHDSLVEGTAAQENLGGGVGLYAEPWSGGPPLLSVTGTTIQDNAIAGVWLSGLGSYAFSGSSIHGGAGWTRQGLTKCGDAVYARDGVTAWDGSEGLLLEGNALQDGLGAGVFLDDASATLAGNSYARNAVDLVVQGRDCSTPPEGYQDEGLGTAELCPAHDYATCGDEFSLFLELAEPESGYRLAIARPALPACELAPRPSGSLTAGGTGAAQRSTRALTSSTRPSSR